MSCAFEERLDAFVRGELRGAEAESVYAHLRECAGCTREAAWLRAEARLVRERARGLTPPYVQLASVRSALDGKLRPLFAERARRERRAKVARSGGAVLSALAAVAVAFFAATVPSLGRSPATAWLDPADCMTLERGPGHAHAADQLCASPAAGHELVALVENQFDACLLATPHALPGFGICR